MASQLKAIAAKDSTNIAELKNVQLISARVENVYSAVIATARISNPHKTKTVVFFLIRLLF